MCHDQSKTDTCFFVSHPWPAGDAFSPQDPTLTWRDWVPIEPDGSFRVASVPAEGQVQLIAVSDGWISSTTIDDDSSLHFVMGQLFALEGTDLTLTLEMEPTATIEVSLVKPDGRPVTEGKFGTNPNQKLYKSGSQLLGERGRSRDYVQRRFSPFLERFVNYWETPRSFPYYRSLNADGKVTLTGIPIGRSHSLELHHPDFVLQGNDPNDPNSIRFRITLDTPDPVKLNLNARNRPKPDEIK